MSWPEEKLKMIAEEIGAKFADQLPGLEAAFAKLNGELETARRAPGRADTYVATIEEKLQCPACYVQAGRESELVQVDSTAGVDAYRCLSCNTTFPFPY